MFKEHPVFQQPSGRDILVWRYLDFTKFVDMLETRSLFFCRADRFEDRFEGSYPQFNVKLRPQVYSGEKGIPEQALRQMSEFGRTFRSRVAINCWHANQFESAAMWRLYLKSNEGIAIQSTYGQLADSFSDWPEDVFAGLVRYIDYDSEWMPEGNLFYPFVHKRKSFAHENEVRAMICRFPPSGDNGLDLSKETIAGGISVAVDVQKLISRIFVAPDSPTWFAKLVESVARKYQVEAPIVNSSLASEPVY